MNKVGSMRVLLVSCLAGLVMWTWGCGGPSTSAPGPDVPMKTVEAECARMKIPALEEQATAYRDRVRKVLEDMKEVDGRIAKADPDMTSQEDKEKMQAERAKLDKTRVELIQRYQVYLKTLVRRGVNVDKLRIEEPKIELPNG
jgi:hypothetical protein